MTPRPAPPAPRRRPQRDVIAAELDDAIASRAAAFAEYQRVAEYTDAEDRARVHLEHCVLAVVLAHQRLRMFDAGRPIPSRWGGAS